jgi:hypothetical protein
MGDVNDIHEITFASDRKLKWHLVVEASLEKLPDFNSGELDELDKLAIQIEEDNPGVVVMCCDAMPYCNIDEMDCY